MKENLAYESMRSMQQELTFTALRKHFQQRELKLDEAQMRTLKLIGDDGLYTNLALLLSEQCEHSLKVAVFQGSTRAVFRDRRVYRFACSSFYDAFTHL